MAISHLSPKVKKKKKTNKKPGHEMYFRNKNGGKLSLWGWAELAAGKGYSVSRKEGLSEGKRDSKRTREKKKGRGSKGHIYTRSDKNLIYYKWASRRPRHKDLKS